MKLQIKRWIAQIIFAISANLGAFGLKTGFCYPFFYCHSCPASTSACPIRAIEIGVSKGNWNWRFILFPIVIIGSVGVIFGRAVCGWACPIGTLQRATGVIPHKLKEKFPFLKKLGYLKIERYFRYIKYFNLIGLVILIPIFIDFMFTDICPIGFLTGTIPISAINPGEYVPNQFYIIARNILILFIILIFLIERGWCRYFCPVGAMLAPFNKISLVHMSVDKKNCIHCNACSDICPMGIDVPNMNRDLECIICGKCADICPKNVIKLEKR